MHNLPPYWDSLDARKREIVLLANHLAKRVASVVGAAGWLDVAHKVITPRENDEINKVWDSLQGWTCWIDAFVIWLKRH